MILNQFFGRLNFRPSGKNTAKTPCILIKSILLALVVLTSCQDNDIKIDVDATQDATTVSYSIPVDSAISYLNDFMDNAITGGSRSSEKRQIASVSPIKYNSISSRASNENLNCENLFYIANFEQERGYAILAADSRIEVGGNTSYSEGEEGLLRVAFL